MGWGRGRRPFKWEHSNPLAQAIPSPKLGVRLLIPWPCVSSLLAGSCCGVRGATWGGHLNVLICASISPPRPDTAGRLFVLLHYCWKARSVAGQDEC